MVKELANEVKVPIGLHADHDFTYENVMNSINCGFESVMFDGSVNDLDKNIELTRQVVLRKAQDWRLCGRRDRSCGMSSRC